MSLALFALTDAAAHSAVQTRMAAQMRRRCLPEPFTSITSDKYMKTLGGIEVENCP